MDELTPLAMQAARGDGAALTALIRATQGDVWRLCAHLVDAATADDLTQETYLRAIPALRRFRGDSSVRTWLLTIARRVCAHEIRSRQRARRATSLATMNDAEPDTTLRAELTEMLAALDPDRRTAFVLTQVLGCSYAEAATICGCPVGTIRSRVARARADLDAMTGRRTNPIAPAPPASTAPGGAAPADGDGAGADGDGDGDGDCQKS